MLVTIYTILIVMVKQSRALLAAMLVYVLQLVINREMFGENE